jgi:TonB family protein
MFVAAAYILALQSTPTFTPRVDQCNHDAQLLHSAPPRLPAARYATLHGVPEATVAVTVDNKGQVVTAKIVQSAGEADLDAAALDSARTSTYAPATQNCKPVGETFGITIGFQPNDYACNHDAYVVSQGSPPMPDDVTGAKPGKATAIVRVIVAANGTVSGTTLTASTGNPNLDATALQAARQSTYSPKVVDCRAVAGDYIFKVTFDPNQQRPR